MRTWALAVLAMLFLAGCSSGGNGPQVTPIDPDVGVIRGLVVDQSIAPIAGALITISGGRNATTDAAGAFNFTDVVPGDYVVAVTKAGFKGSQVTTHVVGGESEPDMVKLLLERISQATPYLDHFKLEGFYSCTFALPFVTDSCEFVYRTGWDRVNQTGNEPPAPRSVQEFRNTQFIDIPEDTFTIVQEGFWDDESVKTFWIMVDETPIENECDCSTSYANRIGPGGTLLNRLERFDAQGNPNKNFTADETAHDSPKGEFPTGKTVASRGFIPFQESPTGNQDPSTWAATGVNFQFVIITTLFHNYVPDPAWTFETKETFPVG